MSIPVLRRQGFSLIELLFSMVIGSVILILAATLLGTSSDGYERVSNSVTSDREARAAITQLTSDLASGVYHPCEIIEKSSAAWPLDSLGFLSLQPETAQTGAGHIGDLCTVNYYIHDLTFRGKIIRCLVRGFRESNDTFKALHDEDTPQLFKPQFKLDEPIAFGVVSFSASPKRRDNKGKWLDWVKGDHAGPEVFEIKIVIARRNLIGKLKLPSDWDGSSTTTKKLLGESMQADRNKDLEVYTTTLRFGDHATD